MGPCRNIVVIQLTPRSRCKCQRDYQETSSLLATYIWMFRTSSWVGLFEATSAVLSNVPEIDLRDYVYIAAHTTMIPGRHMAVPASSWELWNQHTPETRHGSGRRSRAGRICIYFPGMMRTLTAERDPLVIWMSTYTSRVL